MSEASLGLTVPLRVLRKLEGCSNVLRIVECAALARLPKLLSFLSPYRTNKHIPGF